MKRRIRPTTLYAHPFSKAYWRDAADELKDVRILVFAALMIALRVAMKPLGINIAPNIRINTAFIVNALGAMTFGPVVAVVAAAITDTLGCILFPTGPYFFPFILEEIAGSLIFSLFLYRTKVTATRVILSRFCIDFFVNILLHTPLMMLYYKMIMHKSYVAFQLPHIVKNLLMFPVEGFLLTLFLALMLPILVKGRLIFDKGEGLKFTKKHIVVMAILFVVAAASTTGYFCYDYNTSNHAPRMEDAHPEDLAAITESLTIVAREEGLIGENEIVIANKVYKKLRGDTTVEFNVYATSPETDMARIQSGVRVKTIKEDKTLTQTAKGTVTLVQNDPERVLDLTVSPLEETPAATAGK